MVFTRKPEGRPASSELFKIPAPAGQPSDPPASATEINAQPSSIIGTDLSIEGQSITIRCKGALRINGNIHADLHSKHLAVGDQAVVSGSISATEVDVQGHVIGAIYGSHVLLRHSAHVEGDIHSEHLQIEKGATFDGRSRKVHDASEIAPKLESEAGATSSTNGVATPMAAVGGGSTTPFPIPTANFRRM